NAEQNNPQPPGNPQPRSEPNQKAEAQSAALPVTQVVLFNSGVGYYQREGTVEGNAQVQLAFPVTEVNDLLKSLVLQDQGQGKVGVITYDSHDPVDRTLRSFAIDLHGSPSLAQILHQARGEKVEVVFHPRKDAPSTKLTGTIVGLEAQPQLVGKDRLLEV